MLDNAILSNGINKKAKSLSQVAFNLVLKFLKEEAKQRKDKGVTEAPVAVAVETPEAPVAVEADAAE